MGRASRVPERGRRRAWRGGPPVPDRGRNGRDPPGPHGVGRGRGSGTGQNARLGGAVDGAESRPERPRASRAATAAARAPGEAGAPLREEADGLQAGPPEPESSGVRSSQREAPGVRDRGPFPTPSWRDGRDVRPDAAWSALSRRASAATTSASGAPDAPAIPSAGAPTTKPTPATRARMGARRRPKPRGALRRVPLIGRRRVDPVTSGDSMNASGARLRPSTAPRPLAYTGQPAGQRYPRRDAAG